MSKDKFIQTKKEITQMIKEGDNISEVLYKALTAIQLVKLPDPDFDKAVDKVGYYLNILRQAEKEGLNHDDRRSY